MRLQLIAPFVCLILAAVAAPAASQMPLSPQERTAAAYIDAHTDEAIALLERVVNINSGTMNIAGVKAVGAVFRAELESLGFTVRWVDGAAWQRAGHLVATHPGSSPKVLLIGHLDTVFEADSPFQKFTRVDAKTAGGPGIIDMKGGDVVMLLALKALKAGGALDALNITVVMTGDEEAAGRPLSAARAALVEAATGAAVAMGFEDGDGDPTHAVIARRGTTDWIVRTSGPSGHSSQIFREDIGPGSVFEAARILNAFREQLAGEAHLTFNPGVMLGGTTVQFRDADSRGTAFGKSNVIGEQTVISGDLRALTVEQFDRAKQKMRAIVAASLPHTKAEIAFDDGYPPLAPAPGNERLLVLYDRASQDLGLGRVEAVNPDRAGAADVSFVAAYVPMIIDAIGLKGHDDHSEKETADLTTLPVQAKRAAVTLLRLFR